MTVPAGGPYRKHTENARLVAKGLKQAERAHKAAIGSGQDVAVDFAARVHHMMVGLFAEASLRKTVTDPGGFNDRERGLLGQKRSQLDRWLTAVDLAFRRQYGVPFHEDVNVASVGEALEQQYKEVLDLLANDLAEIIEDRNKIAHGQWAWVLNSKETTFQGKAPAPLNYRAIETRSKLVREIDALIRDLVVSEPTFARDYQRRYNQITQLRTRLAGKDHPELVRQLQARRR